MRSGMNPAIVLLTSLFCAGCGVGPSARYDAVDLAPASGIVTLDGQPLDSAVVLFEDPVNGTFSFGLTDSSGRYQLQLDSVKHGVTMGRKTVRISTALKIPGLNSTEEVGDPGSESEGAKKEAIPEKVPERYNRKSELVAEVSEDQTTFDFALASK